MTNEAAAAIRAAKNVSKWGLRAARVYARKNGAFRLFLLARVLEHENAY